MSIFHLTHPHPFGSSGSTSLDFLPLASASLTPYCDLEKLKNLPIDQALEELSVIANKDPRFFTLHYEKFPPLSTDQALPLLRIVAEKDPSGFAAYYEKFPPLSADQAFPLLIIVATENPRGLVLYHKKFPCLSVDQALVIFKSMIRRDSSYQGLLKGLSNSQCFLRFFKTSPPIVTELTNRFLKGELKSKEDIPLIEYIMQYSPIFEDGSVDNIENIVRNIAKDTAHAALSALGKYHKDLLLIHFPHIFTHLTTPFETEGSERIDKAHFFEVIDDIEMKHYLLLSFPIIGKEFAEWEASELQKKDAEIWRCVGRRKQAQGYLYSFTFKTEFNNLQLNTEKFKAIFPAIEPRFSDLELVLETSESAHFYKQLGYSMQGRGKARDEIFSIYQDKSDVIFTIPDREALLDRYNTLRSSTNQNLPELSIVSSQGIASDTDFIRVFTKDEHDGLLSEGKEFIHDHFFHILPLLMTARNGRMFYQRIKIVKLARLHAYTSQIDLIIKKKKYESFSLTKEQWEEMQRNLPILETVLGAFVDGLQTMEFKPGSRTVCQVLDENSLATIFYNPYWVYYFEKRYSADRVLPTGECIPRFDISVISRLATLIDNLVIVKSR